MATSVSPMSSRPCLNLADLGQRIDYGLFSLALVVFFIGLIGDFTAVSPR